jgi:hypothetical protein
VNSARFDQAERLKSGIPRVLIKPCGFGPLQPKLALLDARGSPQPAPRKRF